MFMICVTLPYLTSGVDRLLHLPNAEAVSARLNARPRNVTTRLQVVAIKP